MKNSFIFCLNAVTPTFLIMCVGYLCKRIGIVTRDMVRSFNKIIFNAFFPVMLFYNIYNSDMAGENTGKLILFIIMGVLAEILISIPVARRTVKDPAKIGTVVQGMFRANTVIVGLPIAMELLGDVDLGPVVIAYALAVPMFNIMSVITLQMFNGQQTDGLSMLKNILKNPLVIAAIAAFTFKALKLTLPSPLLSTVRSMSQAASPVMLFLVGAFFSFDDFGNDTMAVAVATAFRLAVFPALFLTVGMLMGFRGAEFVALIVIFASSNSTSSFSMAQQLGGDSQLAGKIVVITNALCPAAFFIWSYLFKKLGAF